MKNFHAVKPHFLVTTPMCSLHDHKHTEYYICKGIYNENEWNKSKNIFIGITIRETTSVYRYTCTCTARQGKRACNNNSSLTPPYIFLYFATVIPTSFNVLHIHEYPLQLLPVLHCLMSDDIRYFYERFPLFLRRDNLHSMLAEPLRVCGTFIVCVQSCILSLSLSCAHVQLLPNFDLLTQDLNVAHVQRESLCRRLV